MPLFFVLILLSFLLLIVFIVSAYKVEKEDYERNKFYGFKDDK